MQQASVLWRSLGWLAGSVDFRSIQSGGGVDVDDAAAADKHTLEQLLGQVGQVSWCM